jgi:hypothetical protein
MSLEKVGKLHGFINFIYNVTRETFCRIKLSVVEFQNEAI